MSLNTNKLNKIALKSLKKSLKNSNPLSNFSSVGEWEEALAFEKELMYRGKISRKKYLANIKKINQQIQKSRKEMNGE